MKRPRLILAIAALCLGLGASGGVSFADDDDDGDHDKARELVEHGEIHSLQQVLEAIAAQVAGDVVEVRLRSNAQRWIYACKVVTPEGKRVAIAIDAATLAIVQAEEGD